MGAAACLLAAVVAVVAALMAWPHIQPQPGRSGTVAGIVSSTSTAAASRAAIAAQPSAKPPPNEAARMRPPHDEASEAQDVRVRRDREERARVEQEQARLHEQQLAREREAEQERDRERAAMAAREAADRAATERETRREADGDVDRHLAAAATMMRRHDYAAAAESLDEAERAAASDGDLSGRVDRWKLLLDYAKQLDGHVAEAIASANEGREYTIGNRTISIIEIGPNRFAYKEAGAIKRGKELPRVVERAILAAWFDGAPRPANHIFLGVHRLLDSEADLTKVRTEWQAAAAGEPATASIMPLLDDPAVATPPTP